MANQRRESTVKNYEFDTSLSELGKKNNGNIELGIACMFQNFICSCVSEQLPQYKDVFPFMKGMVSNCLFNEKFIVYTATYDVHMSMVCFGTLKDDELICEITDTVKNVKFHCFEQAPKAIYSKHICHNKFIYFSGIEDGKMSTEHFGDYIIDWLNTKVLPNVLENNRLRVLDAIPAPPNFNIEMIMGNIFVLEDESNDIDDLGKQGTCFYVENVGFITCNHVLTKGMKLFHANKPAHKYAFSTKKKNGDIDISVLDVHKIEKPVGFEIGNSDELKIMEHIAIAGFPKYQLGDKGFLSPGLITGFRTVSGIQRIVVNVPIVAGNSGGPVINSCNKVIGIAVKGYSNGELECLMSSENPATRYT
jgi:hypothetical protein